MVEWSITAVLKTAVLKGTGGSNPSLSAIKAEKSANYKTNTQFYSKECKIGCFCIITGWEGKLSLLLSILPLLSIR